MNKRFFTLMAAVMLAGSPFASEAFAATDVVSYVGNEMALANGTKFYLGTAANALLKVTKISTKEGQSVYTIATGTETDAVEKAFTIRNYKTTAAGATFELVADGLLFVTTPSGAKAATDTKLADLNTAFAVTSGKVNFANLYTAAFPAVEVKSNGSSLMAFTENENVDAAYLNEYNSNGTSLSFDYSTSELVGNLFAGLTPITFEQDYVIIPDGEVNPTKKLLGGQVYFVSGKTDDIKELKAKIAAAETDGPTDDAVAAIFAAAEKVTFLAVDPSVRYTINGKQDTEGHRLYQMKGAVASTPDSTANARFAIKTVDNFNKDGELSVQVTPTFKYTTSTTSTVKIAAVLPSASDTKTYVTTVKTSGSNFTSVKNPTLGANSYMDASILLKKNQENVVNIYFTSNNKSYSEYSGTQTEYHKYLVVDPANGTKLVARPLVSVDFTMPTSQWIVSNFNGKYGYTLTNRETGKELYIELQPNGKEGGYYVRKATYNGADAQLTGGDGLSLGVEDATDIKATSVKFNTIPTTRTDGALALTAEQLANGIKLQLEGADYVFGAKTQYVEVPDRDGAKILSSADEEDADVIYPIRVKGADDHATKSLRGVADYVISTKSFAYLDANGNVAIKAAGDTLVVPTYAFQVNDKSGKDARYMYNVATTDTWTSDDGRSGFVNTLNQGNSSTDKAEYAFVKNSAGKYSLVAVASAAKGIATYANVQTAQVVRTYPTAGDDVTYIYLNHVARFAKASDFTGNYANVTIAEAIEPDLSLPAVARHATLDNKLGSISFQVNKENINEGILAAEGLTFWLDTADSQASIPAFYISKGINAETKAAEDVNERMFMFNATDSLTTFVEGTAQEYTDDRYYLDGTGDTKVIFRPAVLEDVDVIATTVDGEAVKVVKKAEKAGEVEGLDNFKFYIGKLDEDAEEYVLVSKKNNYFVYSLNGKLGLTDNQDKALLVTLGEGDPTANEAIAAEAGVQVIGGQGVVTVQGAAGKVVTVANILGQTIANQVATSDNVTIAVPAGIVVVSVDGEATKVIVK